MPGGNPTTKAQPTQKPASCGWSNDKGTVLQQPLHLAKREQLGMLQHHIQGHAERLGTAKLGVAQKEEGVEDAHLPPPRPRPP